MATKKQQYFMSLNQNFLSFLRPKPNTSELKFMTENYVQILDILKKYLDLLYHGDTESIDQIFFPEATVSSVTNGKIVSIDMTGFNERVTNRKSPASIGEKREDKILMIDISSPTTAMAKVKCMILKNQYTDYLLLIKVEGKWRIISKIFHMQTD